MKKKLFLISAICILANPAIAKPKTNLAPDYIFYNGNVFTAAENKNKNAIAIKDGIITFVGDDKSALLLAGKKTKKIDLNGKTLMPGIIDAHMHPQSGGLKTMMCNLEYLPLSMAQMNERIQKCLDNEKNAGPNDWLVVINWFEQEMQPSGFAPIYKDLESLKTTRPVYVKNSFGHAAIMNARAMEIINLKNQKDRAGGIIVKDKQGNPTGRLEDAARDIVSEILPQPNEQKNLEAAKRAQILMSEQGITTILDAYTDIETMNAYQTLSKNGQLNLRPHFAVLIDPDKEPDNKKSIAELIRQKQIFDQGAQTTIPSLSVHSAKIFLDGTVAMPSMTGNMLEPYFENHGTDENPHWRPGKNKGPKTYLTHDNLLDIMIQLSDLDIDTHLHADGDGAVNLALNATQSLLKARPNSKTRTAIAHAESVSPQDFARFGELGALPILSFQWGKPAGDTWEGAKDILGPARHAIFEPQGLLEIYGAKIVFGSDWPVDPLNEWHALEVALTRMADGEGRKKYPMRLGIDPALSLETALKAMTINAAFSLHVENVTGSIEVGKFADLIILDRDLFKTNSDDISSTKVMLTMVGGKIVFERK